MVQCNSSLLYCVLMFVNQLVLLCLMNEFGVTGAGPTEDELNWLLLYYLVFPTTVHQSSPAPPPGWFSALSTSHSSLLKDPASPGTSPSRSVDRCCQVVTLTVASGGSCWVQVVTTWAYISLDLECPKPVRHSLFYDWLQCT